MVSRIKKILHIYLDRGECEVRSYPEAGDFIGGYGLGVKLLSQEKKGDPVIFSVGPLNGFFPYVSKTSIVFMDSGNVEDVYLGGALSFRIKFSGMDAISLIGKSKNPIVLEITNDSVSFKPTGEDTGKLGLPGKKSVLNLSGRKLTLDGYFKVLGDSLGKKLHGKNIESIVFTGTKTFEIIDDKKYSQIYNDLLERVGDLTVEKSTNISCSGCSMGCEHSKLGEVGGDSLVHSLVACTYAEPIYSDIGTAFSCLNVLGYDYTHEDIENLPLLINELKEDLEK